MTWPLLGRRLDDVVLPDVLLVEDVSRALRLSAGGVRRLLRLGLLPGRRLGRRWLVARRDLLDALRTTPARNT